MKLLTALLKQHSELLKCGKLGNSKNRPYCSKCAQGTFIR